jgi:hypothetical protein
MSFREKSAWACLVTTLAVFVPYFLYAFTAGQGTHLAGAIAIQAAINIAAQAFIAARSGVEARDERDAAIESKSFRNAYLFLAVALVAAIATMIYAPADPAALNALGFFGQVLLACFIAAESVKYLTQVVCYRRGS